MTVHLRTGDALQVTAYRVGEAPSGMTVYEVRLDDGAEFSIDPAEIHHLHVPLLPARSSVHLQLHRM